MHHAVCALVLLHLVFFVCFVFVVLLLFFKGVYYHSQPKILLLLESGALPDSQIKAILIHRTAAETEESASHVVLLKLQFAHVA